MDKKQKRAAALKRQQELVNAAKAASREMTAEETAEFNTLQGQIDQLNREIADEERQQGGNPPAPPAPSAGAPTTPPDQQREIEERARTAERNRVKEISAICRDFGYDPGKYIDDGLSVEQVRAAVLDELRRDKAPIGTGIHVTDSGEDEFRRDAVDGLLLRGGVQVEKPSNGSAQFAAMSLRDLAITCLERSGVSGARYMSSDEILREICTRQYYNPTAAFPTILDNAINKAYVEGHRTAAVTFDLWTRKGSLKDFKIHDNNYLAGPIGDFLEVPEGGELKGDKPTDALSLIHI